ncbi:MAG TPA: FAD-binding oxidoreductase [Anaerolineales bacterium]|nr:FAD-binding oxidoreductase [Anaerolineales bacterium]
MDDRNPDVLICGAGIAGLSTAYHLMKKRPQLSVVLVDEGPPLSLTSDKSGECYRNFWPGREPSMVRMMNRSIDILEEFADKTDNIFNMNRRGYVFATAQPEKVDAYRGSGLSAQENGAGELRVHNGTLSSPAYQYPPPEGYSGQPDGSDLILDKDLIHACFPEMTERTVALLHVRRAGWLSAQQLGMYLLQEVQQLGARIVHDRVERVLTGGGRLGSVILSGNGEVTTGAFVNAAGPWIQHIGRLIGVELPVFTELHLKASFHDHLGTVSRGAPMLIWGDPEYLVWSEEERNFLASAEETRWFLEEFPSGVHTRPEGGLDSDILLLLWEYNTGSHPVKFPVPLDPEFPELALRGICNMLPGMEAYLERLPKPGLDGGYYTKTQENRPLACPMAIEGTYLIGALSGFGIMASQGLGELLAQLILGTDIPEYAPAFDLRRYQDAGYQKLLAEWGDSWQL